MPRYTPDEFILIKAKEAQTSENRLLQTTQVQPPSSQSCKDSPYNPTAGSAAHAEGAANGRRHTLYLSKKPRFPDRSAPPALRLAARFEPSPGEGARRCLRSGCCRSRIDLAHSPRPLLAVRAFLSRARDAFSRARLCPAVSVPPQHNAASKHL